MPRNTVMSTVNRLGLSGKGASSPKPLPGPSDYERRPSVLKLRLKGTIERPVRPKQEHKPHHKPDLPKTERKCLACGNKFMSWGIANRLCGCTQRVYFGNYALDIPEATGRGLRGAS